MEIDKISKGFDQSLFSDLSLLLTAGSAWRSSAFNESGETTLLRTLSAANSAGPRNGQVGGKATVGYYAQDQPCVFEGDVEEEPTNQIDMESIEYLNLALVR